MQSQIVYLLLAFNLVLASTGQILLKMGTNKLGVFNLMKINDLFKFLFHPLIFSGLVLYGISAITWIALLSRVDLSFAYPMISVSYVLIVFLSKVVFNEPINNYRWLGVFLITLGASLIGIKT